MSMLYHASPSNGIKELGPRVSNHGEARVYFSSKRENVLVYLSNAIEKYCKEAGYSHNGIWTKWGSYGFDSDGILYIDEYYPNALKDTYLGVTGYIYSVQNTFEMELLTDIPFAYTSNSKVTTIGCETITDAYQSIIDAERLGLIHINRYEELSTRKISWIERTIREEYQNCTMKPEYRFFLEGKFGDILK